MIKKKNVGSSVKSFVFQLWVIISQINDFTLWILMSVCGVMNYALFMFPSGIVASLFILWLVWL